MSDPIAEAARGRLWPFFAIYLLTCALALVVNYQNIATFRFPDPDDTLRLQQVRDWIGGQSWFDVRQYRMNPPEGAPMHWSRLVDVPIAAVILLFTPLLGTAGAELAALILVPLLTMGIALALLAIITNRLLDREHALLAMLVVPVSVAIVQQFRPMRIDHHGWQIVIAAGAVLAMIDPRRIRSGLIVGALAALWLNISLEGLPFAAGLVALTALRWARDPEEAPRFLATAASLAGTSLLLFIASRPGGAWLIDHCDQISPVHLAVFGAGAAGTLLVTRYQGASWQLRLALLGGLGVAAGAVLLSMAPQCASGPFGNLDPLVRVMWYERVHEGLPIWAQEPSSIAKTIAFPLVGLFGAWRAFQRASAERKDAWGSLLFLLILAVLVSIMVERASSVANLLAVPGGVFLLRGALLKARAVPTMPRRLAATCGAMLLIAPAHVVYAGSQAMLSQDRVEALRVAETCMKKGELDDLLTIPASDIAAPLDLSPAILTLTHHRIIASGHHRNHLAMRDTIAMFMLPPDRARKIVARRGIEYVAICPGLPEPRLYTMMAPRGLMARLQSRRQPDWLEPVALTGPHRLRLWRVKPVA